MRFYELTLFKPDGTPLVLSSRGFESGNGPTFSSLHTQSTLGAVASTSLLGTNNPGALDVELDIPVWSYHTPAQGRSRIVVWGIGIKQLWQPSNLNDEQRAKLTTFAGSELGGGAFKFRLRGGMSKGLPLATAAANQAGVLAEGVIWQALGQWQGTNTWLELMVQPGDLVPDTNVMFVWPEGSSLKDAISASLSQAFPKLKQDIQITDILAPGLICHIADKLSTFASFVFDRTLTLGQAKMTGGKTYPGISMVPDAGTIYVFDDAPSGKPVNLLFQDLIGQPTWLEPNTISVKTVLRADLGVGDTFTFPKGFTPASALTTLGAAPPGTSATDRAVFQGTFWVKEVHHYGRFRQPDGDSWCSVFTAVPVPS